jgi:hypothetical protein
VQQLTNSYKAIFIFPETTKPYEQTLYKMFLYSSQLKLFRNIQSKKDIQYNGQNKKDKTENNGLQNITQKIKYRVPRTH